MFIIKKIFRVLLYIAGTFMVIALCIFAWMMWYGYQPLTTKKFNSEEWVRAGLEFKPELRCGMYHDLTRNYLKRNMRIEEAEELLGRGNTWIYCKDKEIKCARYGMGVCFSNALTVHHDALYACFNKKGRLVSFDRRTHCTEQGNYYVDTKEQLCDVDVYFGDGTSEGWLTHDCKIVPW